MTLRLQLLACLALALTPSAWASSPTLIPGHPAEVGLNPVRVEAAVQLFRDSIQRDELRGAVLLVARDGRVIVHEAMGWRDKEAGQPMQLDTLFRLASNTKATVATAAMIMAERGTLNLDATLPTYIPAFGTTGFAPTTIRQLLAHSGGVPGSPIFISGVQASSNLVLEANRFAVNLQPAATPGTQYIYSNASYNILGGVLEAVSGKRLDVLLRDEIYLPLGMHDSSNHEPVADNSRMGKVYVYENGNWRVRWKPFDPPTYPIVRASGGMIATAWDFSILLQTWLNGGSYGDTTILSPAAVVEGMSVQSATSRYGFGWTLLTSGTLTHSGSDGTYAWVDPNRRTIGAIFTQSPGGINPRVTFRQRIEQALAEGPPPPAFTTWAQAHGLAGTNAELSADPAGDGHANLAKFAFGADPNLRVPVLVDVASEGGLLVLRWNRSTHPGITYAVESATAPAPAGWSPVANATPAVMAAPDRTPPAGYERVEWSVNPATAGAQAFFRVHADIASWQLP